MATYHQYSSAVPFFQEQAAAGLPEFDQNRIRAYNLYEQMYWNHPETFRLLQRGEDQAPIYLPSARKIVEATNRFLGVDMDFVVEAGEGGTDGDKQLVEDAFAALFKRERFYTKYISQKRNGLIRGDVIWHITADPAKPEGERISIHEVHPSQYFPIMDPDNDTRVLGCHLVDTVKDPNDDNKQLARVQTYRKTETGSITTELALFEIGKWDDRNLEPTDITKVQQLVNPTELPPVITSLPVYHIPNGESQNGKFGHSLVRGIELVLAAINQSISDEDLALVMSGLGGYWTDAAPPINEAGEPTAWELGPLRMTEVPQGRVVGRLQGVGSVAPSQDHIKLLEDSGATGVGVPDIAMGKVDVAVAESGISLQFQLSPILAGNAEREMAMIGIYDQMFFDIARMWFAAYEGITTEVSVATIFGDPLPINRAGVIEEVTALVTAKLITIAEGRQMLIDRLGLEISADSAEVLAEQKSLTADPFAERVNAELGANDTQEVVPSE